MRNMPVPKVIQEGRPFVYPIVVLFSQERRSDPARILPSSVTPLRSLSSAEAPHPWDSPKLSLVGVHTALRVPAGMLVTMAVGPRSTQEREVRDRGEHC